MVREALRDWKMKSALQPQELASLKADIDRGLSDLAVRPGAGSREHADRRTRAQAIGGPVALRFTEATVADLAEAWATFGREARSCVP